MDFLLKCIFSYNFGLYPSCNQIKKVIPRNEKICWKKTCNLLGRFMLSDYFKKNSQQRPLFLLLPFTHTHSPRTIFHDPLPSHEDYCHRLFFQMKCEHLVHRERCRSFPTVISYMNALLESSQWTYTMANHSTLSAIVLLSCHWRISFGLLLWYFKNSKECQKSSFLKLQFIRRIGR